MLSLFTVRYQSSDRASRATSWDGVSKACWRVIVYCTPQAKNRLNFSELLKIFYGFRLATSLLFDTDEPLEFKIGDKDVKYTGE